MFKYIPLLLLISTAFTSEGRFGVEEDENVAVLSDSNFNDFVKNKKLNQSLEIHRSSDLMFPKVLPT